MAKASLNLLLMPELISLITPSRFALAPARSSYCFCKNSKRSLTAAYCSIAAALTGPSSSIRFCRLNFQFAFAGSIPACAASCRLLQAVLPYVLLQASGHIRFQAVAIRVRIRHFVLRFPAQPGCVSFRLLPVLSAPAQVPKPLFPALRQFLCVWQ